MLPLPDVIRGLLAMHRVSSCILPRIQPSAGAVLQHLHALQPYSQPLGRQWASLADDRAGTDQQNPEEPRSVTRGPGTADASSRVPGLLKGPRPSTPAYHLYRQATSAANLAAAVPEAGRQQQQQQQQQQQRRTAQFMAALREPLADEGEGTEEDDNMLDRYKQGDRQQHPEPSQEQQRWQQQSQQQQPQPHLMPQQGRYGGPHLVHNPPPVWQQQQQAPMEQRLPVKAYFLGGEINLQKFVDEKKFAGETINVGRDSCIIELHDNEDTVLLGAGRDTEVAHFMAVFRFGAVIFFGSPVEGHQEWLDLLRGYSSATQKAEVQDETTVVVRSSLERWVALEPDQLVVQALDVGNTKVIGLVLGQSVALDHYNREVDAAIQVFSPYLREIAQHGESKRLNELRLLQLIGENSLLYTDVVTKLGLLDTSDTAWRNDNYYEVWQALRKDYELERRFEALNRKLGPMLENAKFILEVREDRKTETSERTIIYLIAIEIILHAATSFFF